MPHDSLLRLCHSGCYFPTPTIDCWVWSRKCELNKRIEIGWNLFYPFLLINTAISGVFEVRNARLLSHKTHSGCPGEVTGGSPISRHLPCGCIISAELRRHHELVDVDTGAASGSLSLLLPLPFRAIVYFPSTPVKPRCWEKHQKMVLLLLAKRTIPFLSFFFFFHEQDMCDGYDGHFKGKLLDSGRNWI